MSYWLHEEAEAKLNAAAVYYAEQASQRIALVFLDRHRRCSTGCQGKVDVVELRRIVGLTAH